MATDGVRNMTDWSSAERPVFILGCHRSGTTILYNALVEVGVFCHPTPYHLSSFGDYLANPDFDQTAAIARIGQRFRDDGISDRFVDGIAAHALSPEEYGFAIPGERLSPPNLETFEAFCAFVRSRAETERVLLLKNPADMGNAACIRKVYPGARFIFVHRHPGPTIASRLRELKALFFDYSPYQAIIQPDYAGIMQGRFRKLGIRISLRLEILVTFYLLREMTNKVSLFLRDAQSLPDDIACSMTYESLCEAPVETINEILSFLRIDAPAPSHIDQLVRPVRREPMRDFVLDSSIALRWLRPYLEYCGYDGLWPAEDNGESQARIWPSNAGRGEDVTRGDRAADEAEAGKQRNRRDDPA